MSGNGSPDDADLHWPVARGELDDLATLELGRDAGGRLAWQNMAPPGPDSYKAWLAKRETAPPRDPVPDVFGDDPIGALFASESTSNVSTAPVPPADTTIVSPVEEWNDPSVTRPPAPSADALTALPLKDQGASTGVAAVTSTALPFWSTTGAAAPLRLSLAFAPVETRQPARAALPPPETPPRTRGEQLALLGSGALIGVAATMIVGVAWLWETRGAPAARRAAAARTASPSAPAVIPAAPLPVGLVRLTEPVLPGASFASVLVPMGRAAAPVVATAGPPPVPVVTAAAPRQASTSPHRTPRASTVVTPDPPATAPVPIPAPPEALATVDRFAAAYNRMDASATQAVWPAADRQALITTFTALREQRLTLSGCRGTMQEDTATVMCRGSLRYRPRVGNHDTRIVEGTWRFRMLQRAGDWVLDTVESP